MPQPQELPSFNYRWSTLHHYDHPHGDLLWHLIWGVVIGGSILWALVTADFLFLVIALFALIFFFHPFFAEHSETRAAVTNDGIELNGRRLPWEAIEGFELYTNGDRHFLYLVPRSLAHFGTHLPLDSHVNHEALRQTLRQFLREYRGAVSVLDRWYRALYR